jgi:hypothetical protein
MNESEQASYLELLAARQQLTENVLARYKIRPELTTEELAQVVMYLSDRVNEEQRQRQAMESRLGKLEDVVEQLKPGRRRG